MRYALLCDKYTLPLIEGQGGFFHWLNKSHPIIGYHTLCGEWLLNQDDLKGLRVFEPFGGLGIGSTVIQHMLNPVSDTVCEIDSDCLKQLEQALAGFFNVKVEYGDAFKTLLITEAELYVLDWPGYTVYQYGKWQKQWDAMFSHQPRAITWFDSSAVYLPTHRERYSRYTGRKIVTKEDYRYAVSEFMWERHGYSITRTAEDPVAHMTYFMARPTPPGEIEQYIVPKEDYSKGFRFLD